MPEIKVLLFKSKVANFETIDVQVSDVLKLEQFEGFICWMAKLANHKIFFVFSFQTTIKMYIIGLKIVTFFPFLPSILFHIMELNKGTIWKRSSIFLGMFIRFQLVLKCKCYNLIG